MTDGLIPGDQIMVEGPQLEWASIDSVIPTGRTYGRTDHAIVICVGDNAVQYKFRNENGLWAYGIAHERLVKRKLWRPASKPKKGSLICGSNNDNTL
jgi:hypothetical protein